MQLRLLLPPHRQACLPKFGEGRFDLRLRSPAGMAWQALPAVTLGDGLSSRRNGRPRRAIRVRLFAATKPEAKMGHCLDDVKVAGRVESAGGVTGDRSFLVR